MHDCHSPMLRLEARTLLSTYSWTGTNTNWNSATSWDPAGPPSSSTGTQLVFDVQGTGVSQDDLASGFILNEMSFGSALSASFAVSGNAIVFGGTAVSAIASQSNSAVSINNAITLPAGVTGVAVTGAGVLSLTGANSLTTTDSTSTLSVTQGTVTLTDSANWTLNPNLMVTGASTLVNAQSQNSLSINGGSTITLDGGATLNLERNLANGGGALQRSGNAYAFGAGGGTLNLGAGPLSPADPFNTVWPNSVTVNSAAGTPGIIEFSQYPTTPGQSAWGNALSYVPRLSAIDGTVAGTGTLRFELSDGAMVMIDAPTTYGQTFEFYGPASGNVAGNSTSTELGRLSLNSNGVAGNMVVQGGMEFSGIMQVLQAQGPVTIASDITIAGGQTAFSASNMVGSGNLLIGADASTSFAIQNTAIGILDFGFRSDLSNFNYASVLNSATVIEAGGTFKVTYSQASNPDITQNGSIVLNGPIEGQGAASNESLILLDSSIGGVIGGTSPVANRVVVNSALQLTIDGTSPLGLRVQGEQADVDAFLSGSLLTNLHAAGTCTSGLDDGTLTVAYSNTGAVTGQPFDAMRDPSANPSCIRLGFDAVSGNTPTYLMGAVAAQTLTWQGLAISGGTVQCQGNIAFTQSSANLLMSGGAIQLVGPEPDLSPCSFVFGGGATITAGNVEGGTAGGVLQFGDIVTVSGGSSFNIGGNFQAPEIVFGAHAVVGVTADGVLVNSTGITLQSGTFFEANGHNFNAGVLTVSGGGTLNMDGGSIIHFTDSSAATWSGIWGISNWNGKFLGGGDSQIIFPAGGITPTQLSNTIFENPFGVDVTIPAMTTQLPSGEIVPQVFYVFTATGAGQSMADNANWLGGAAPVAAASSNIVVFSASGLTSATNDISPSLALHVLGFAKKLDTDLTLSGNDLLLYAFNGNNPVLGSTSSQTVTIGNAIGLQEPTTVLRGSADSLVVFNGVISGVASSTLDVISGNYAFSNTDNSFGTFQLENGATASVKTDTGTNLKIEAAPTHSYLGTVDIISAGTLTLDAGADLELNRKIRAMGGTLYLKAANTVKIGGGSNGGFEIDNQAVIHVQPNTAGGAIDHNGISLNAINWGFSGPGTVHFDGLLIGATLEGMFSQTADAAMITYASCATEVNAATSAWSSNLLGMQLSSVAANNQLIFSLTEGAGVVLYQQNPCAGTLAFAGQPGGNPASSASGAGAFDTGRLLWDLGGATLNMNGGTLAFESTMQVSAASAGIIPAAVNVSSGETAFSGAVASGATLAIGTSANAQTLSVAAGATAIFDLELRDDITVQAGLAVNTLIDLAQNASMRFTQTQARAITVENGIDLSGNIQGHGQPGQESLVLFDSPHAFTVTVGTQTGPGLNISPAIEFVVSGQSAQGLRLQGDLSYLKPILDANLLNHVQAGVSCVNNADAGTLTIAFADAGTAAHYTFNAANGPSAMQCVRLGLAAVEGNNPQYGLGLVGGATPENMTWNGLVLSGGTAQCVGAGAAFVGSYANAGLGWLDGEIQTGPSGCTLSFDGGALVMGGSLTGGNVGGSLVVDQGMSFNVQTPFWVNGTLSTSGITIHSGALSLGDSGLIVSAPSIDLAGAAVGLHTYGHSQQFGPLAVGPTASSAAFLDLGAAGVISFADSSALSWSGNFTIQNWVGSFTGGGANQVFFGDSEAGLTLSQVQAIRFENPRGIAGTLQARLLPTGELVPSLQMPPSYNYGGNPNTVFVNPQLLPSGTNTYGVTIEAPGGQVLSQYTTDVPPAPFNVLPADEQRAITNAVNQALRGVF